MRIGVCTGGGDCPGLNAAIRSIVKYANRQTQVELIGIQDSFKGLQEEPPKYKNLVLSDVTDIYFKGGTILGTYNKKPNNLEEFNKNIESICKGYHTLKLDCLIIIGGEGTQSIAKKLSSLNLKIIGIPKTIDNDLPETDQTIGFSTCVDLVSESVIRLQSTAESHDRVMILEVMGRDSGYIGLYGGLAGGAHVILIPEIPFDYNVICKKLMERKKLGRNYSVIVVSEGAKEHNNDSKPALPIGQTVAKELSHLINMESRVTVLGHLQRGGMPNAHDRNLATKLGVFAFDLIKKKTFGKLIATKGPNFVAVDYKKIKSRTRRKVSPTDITLIAAESIGICFGRANQY